MLYFYNVFVNERKGGREMSRNYTVQTKILRPVADVFDAVISSERLKGYFVNGASGNLVEGERVV